MTLDTNRIENHINNASDNREKIDLMNHYGFKIFQTDIEYAAQLSRDALEASRTQKYEKGIAQALMNLGYISWRRSQYNEGYEFIKEAEEILRHLHGGKKAGLNKVLNCKGVIEFQRGEYSHAAASYREALNISETIGDLDMLGGIYCNLAALVDRLGQTEKSLDYCIKAAGILKNTTNYRSYISALNNSGHNYNLLGEYQKALAVLEEAYEVIRQRKIKEYTPIVLSSLGEVNTNLGFYEKAGSYYQAGLESARENGNFADQISLLFGLSELSAKKDEQENAENYLKEALFLVEKKGIAFYAKEVHTRLKEHYLSQEEFKKAFFHLDKIYRIDKNNFSLEMDKNIKNIEAESLKKSNQRIRVISTIGRKITANLDLDSVLEMIYTTVNSFMDATIFGIAGYHSESGKISYEMFVEDGSRTAPFYTTIDDSKSLAPLVIRDKRDIIIHNYEKEYKQLFPGTREDFKDFFTFTTKKRQISRSILFTPLLIEDEVKGIITVQSYKKNAYNYADLDSLKALASYVAIALNNARQARLIKEQNKELSAAHKKITKDLMLAKKLQNAMIPVDFPRSKEYKMYGYYNPIEDLGGDLYDVYSISDEKTVFFILDVVGHGVYASLVTAMAKVLFHNKSADNLTASQIVETVNREITPITGESFTYFSLFFGIINTKNHTLEYVNASHPEPYLIRPGTPPLCLTSASLYLGLREEYQFTQQTIRLHREDRLVLFTDGFYEFQCKNGERFGEKRLLETMIKHKSLPPEEAVKQLNREIALSQITESESENDDRAMLIIDFSG